MSKTMREIVAGTRWAVWVGEGLSSSVSLQGSDFTNDVVLQVTGDFATSAEHLAYAKALAEWLNGSAE